MLELNKELFSSQLCKELRTNQQVSKSDLLKLRPGAYRSTPLPVLFAQ